MSSAEMRYTEKNNSEEECVEMNAVEEECVIERNVKYNPYRELNVINPLCIAEDII